jgi:hypothetical protein
MKRSKFIMEQEIYMFAAILLILMNLCLGLFILVDSLQEIQAIDVNDMISYHMAICAESNYNDSFHFELGGSQEWAFQCCKNKDNTSLECRKLMPAETNYSVVRGYVVKQ